MSDNNEWYWESLLPDSLKQGYEADIKTTVRQVSQLTAWSWSSVLAFEGEAEESQERTLKQFFIEAFQTIGQNVAAYESYEVGDTMKMALYWSSYLSLLFLGDNAGIVTKMAADGITPNTGLDGVTLTLYDVLNKLQGVPGQDFPMGTKEFNEKFILLVTFNSFQGIISEKSQKGSNPNLNNAPNPLPNTDPSYVMMFTYPPRPALSEVTITEEKMSNWAKNILGPNENPYLGPAYMPIQSS